MPPVPEEPEISIVIATCSRAAMLRDCLDSLAAQQTEFSFDIVIVNDGSADNTEAVVNEFAASSHIHVTKIDGPCQGVSAARNAGVHAARGAWIASFDDDQIASAHWLQNLRTLAETTHAACVGGRLKLQLQDGSDPKQLGVRVRRVLGEHDLGASPVAYASGRLPATNNVLFRRSVFDELNGFDLTYTEGGEDTDFFNGAVANGHSLWYQPVSEAMHITPPHRLYKENLRWTSMRVGVSDARLNLRKRGVVAASAAAALRIGVAVVRDIPQLIFAALRGETSAIRNVECSLWYTQGMLRALPIINSPRESRSQFLRTLDFRSRNGERPGVTKRPATDS